MCFKNKHQNKHNKDSGQRGDFPTVYLSEQINKLLLKGQRNFVPEGIIGVVLEAYPGGGVPLGVLLGEPLLGVRPQLQVLTLPDNELNS